MLRIYWDALEVIRLLQPILERVKLRDPNLADQCDRASTAVPLHIAEGGGLRGGNRRLRYSTALSEARETWSCCDVIETKSLARIDPEIRERLNKIIGTLVNIVRP